MGLFIIKDTSLSGEILYEQALLLPVTRISLRELIRARVGEEVRKRNENRSGNFQMLVELTKREQRLNLRGRDQRRLADPEKQITLALEAFQRNAFFVLVGDRQVDNLDQMLELTEGTEVSFLKLTPLIGG